MNDRNRPKEGRNKMISEGDVAPDFDLPKDGGGTLVLSKLKGKPVVLYFYPKDDTSGCTKEAIDFTTLSEDFSKLCVEVIGVSPDSAKKHDKFKSKHNLAVTLVADEEKITAQDYDVWVEKKMYGRTYMGVERSTFLIDAQGKIVRAWRKVKVPGHAEVVLNEAKDL